MVLPIHEMSLRTIHVGRQTEVGGGRDEHNEEMQVKTIWDEQSQQHTMSSCSISSSSGGNSPQSDVSTLAVLLFVDEVR